MPKTIEQLTKELTEARANEEIWRKKVLDIKFEINLYNYEKRVSENSAETAAKEDVEGNNGTCG